jgi:hypothetical protein
MTLSGAPPQPQGYPPIAILPYYQYIIVVEKFPVQVIQRHRNAPPPPTGQGWRKGGFLSLEKEVFYRANFS